MTARCIRLGLVLGLALGIAAPTAAQDWRGMGRVAGKVLDEQGQPIEGVTVKAMLAAADNRGLEVKSNRKGDWALGGIASGVWALDFIKDGYETRSISVPISGARIPPMEIVLKKAEPVVDPNVEIKEQLTQAATLMNAKEYAQARAIYEELSQKYPEVTQFEPLIARTYYGEGNRAKAIEHLRSASARDPENVEVRMLLGNILVEDGQAEEGRQILESVDDSKVTDPTIYVNVGIEMINEGKHADAVTWFDKAIQRFPNQPDAYYYRGVSKLSLGDGAAAKADLEKYTSLAQADAPEMDMAKKILDSLK